MVGTNGNRSANQQAAPLETAVRYLAANAAQTGLGWWQTCTASVLVDCAREPALVRAMAELCTLLHDGEFDPDWLCGGSTAQAALAVAREWVDAGVKPAHMRGWFRAGCYEARAAAALTQAGLRPRIMLSEDQRTPRHWVETNQGTIPLLVAVCQGDLLIPEAIHVIDTHQPGRTYVVGAPAQVVTASGLGGVRYPGEAAG